jgi:hypothetical protein
VRNISVMPFVFDDRSPLTCDRSLLRFLASGSFLFDVRSIAPYRAIDRPSRFLCWKRLCMLCDRSHPSGDRSLKASGLYKQISAVSFLNFHIYNSCKLIFEKVPLILSDPSPCYRFLLCYSIQSTLAKPLNCLIQACLVFHWIKEFVFISSKH